MTFNKDKKDPKKVKEYLDLAKAFDVTEGNIKALMAKICVYTNATDNQHTADFIALHNEALGWLKGSTDLGV